MTTSAPKKSKRKRRRSYSFISPAGQFVKTKTIQAFADQFGFAPSHARDLACGLFSRLNGWCSTHRRAKKHRDRFLTVLIHPSTGQRKVLGQTVTGFAEAHGLCVSELYKLVNRSKLIYRGWMLECTHALAQGTVADGYF